MRVSGSLCGREPGKAHAKQKEQVQRHRDTKGLAYVGTLRFTCGCNAGDLAFGVRERCGESDLVFGIGLC